MWRNGVKSTYILGYFSESSKAVYVFPAPMSLVYHSRESLKSTRAFEQKSLDCS